MAELEQQHGGPIAVNDLRACGRTLYARRSFNELPADVDRPTKSAFGSWWIVSLCERGAPAVVVAVSSLATDVAVDASGGLVYSGSTAGGEFVIRGAAAGRPYGPLATPEEAVVQASRLTGRRVSALPDLLAPSIGKGGGLGALWQLQLEASTSFKRKDRSTTTELVTDKVALRSSDNEALVIADASQPTSQPFYRLVGAGENVTFQLSSVPRDPTAPLTFTAVVPTEAP